MANTTTTINKNLGTSVVMDTSGLTALSGSSTSVGWQSQLVNTMTSLSVDYQITVGLAMGASAPGADKVVYCYVIPWYNDGTTWYANSDGTTTNLSNSTTGGAITIGVPANNLGNPQILNYNVASEVIRKNFNISTFLGDTIPDGWQLVLINNTTATVIASTNTVLAYKPINWASVSS